MFKFIFSKTKVVINFMQRLHGWDPTMSQIDIANVNVNILYKIHINSYGNLTQRH